MTADRLSRLSLKCGLGGVGLFAVALVLLEAFPPAPGHLSGFTSKVGPLLLIMSMFAFLLAPIALVTGVKALRRFPAEAPRSQKLKAWVGVATGGFYSAILAVPFVLIPLMPQSPDAAQDPSVVGIYQSENKPENTTELRADGTFTVREDSQVVSGKYQVKGNTLTLMRPSGEPVVGSVSNGIMIDPGRQRWVKQ
jgi:hypothetical protein